MLKRGERDGGVVERCQKQKGHRSKTDRVSQLVRSWSPGKRSVTFLFISSCYSSANAAFVLDGRPNLVEPLNRDPGWGRILGLLSIRLLHVVDCNPT